jgi:signal transduction histidine kinase
MGDAAGPTVSGAVWAGPYFASAAIAWAIGLLVLFRGRGPVRRPFLALLISVGLTLFTTGTVFLAADAHAATWVTRVSQTAALFAPACGLEFAHTLVGRPLVLLRRIAWGAAVVMGAFALGTPWVIAGARAYPYGFAAVPGPLYPVALALMSLAGTVPMLLQAQLRVERRARERDQLFVVAVSSWLGSLALVDALPLLGVDAPPVGWLPLLFAAVGLLSAIIRHRLVDIRLAARRTLLWLAFTVLGAQPFALAAFVLGPRLQHRGPWALPLLFAVLVVGMRAHLMFIQPRIDRLVGKRGHDIDAEMKVLADQAATLQTTEALGRAIDRFLGALDRRLAALVVIEPSGRPRVALSAWGSVPAPSRGSPLLLELAHVKALIARDYARGPARLEIERACVRWGAEFLGPLVEGEQLLGMIAISPRQGGGITDAVELEALDRMCVTVTAALAGARLYERLHALSGELEQKAQARSASLAKTLRDLRGAEHRLVQSEKLASLGQIVAGVAADLSEEVQNAFADVARLREEAEVLVAAAQRARAARPGLGDPRFDEIARDVGPLLDAVSEGARRAYAIAQDLSGFAMTEGAEAPRQPRKPAHLAALIDSTLTLVTGHLADVAVVRDYDETLPAVPIEVGPLGQVVLNLILNATQAMRGSGTLTLATRRVEAQAEFSVSDTGPGIPADVLPRIFEPFFSTKGPTTGTGLGLSISYGIVTRHGGRISVDSMVGVGTTFRVQLPIGE